MRYFALQIGQSIAYLHKRCIVHRDIKPENVLVSKEGNTGILTLTDFGSATQLLNLNEVASGKMIGTKGYMAPELVQGEPHSYPCDVWSFGCLIYRLIAGNSPFITSKTDPDEYFTRVCTEELTFPEPIWSEISSDCKALLTRMLQKSPANR